MSQALEVIEVIEGEITNTPLSDEERAEHAVRVAAINTAFQDIGYKSLEIWQNLKWIKDNRTYREEHDTFQDFCKNDLGKDNSQIYRYLKDAELKEKFLLEASTDAERLSIMSLKEGNTRFIRTLSPEIQLPFWKVAYGLGIGLLAKKDDDSIEHTTAFLESTAAKMNEILEQGGIHIDGQFVSVDSVVDSAKIDGVDEDTAKAILLRAGVSEEAYEALKRQADHIREKSAKADITTLKGTIESQLDSNGSEYPVLVDSKGNEYDLFEVLLSFNNRFVNISVKSPIRDV